MNIKSSESEGYLKSSFESTSFWRVHSADRRFYYSSKVKGFILSDYILSKDIMLDFMETSFTEIYSESLYSNIFYCYNFYYNFF